MSLYILWQMKSAHSEVLRHVMAFETPFDVNPSSHVTYAVEPLKVPFGVLMGKEILTYAA